MLTLATLAWTFFRLSFLCLGGGIGAIPEMQRQVVGIQGWLTARQFVDGYALSQVTPGPAMLVTVFIGYRVSGLPGALVAMAAMFLPTALLTWFVAHRWERLRGTAAGGGRGTLAGPARHRSHGRRRVHGRPIGGDGLAHGAPRGRGGDHPRQALAACRSRRPGSRRPGLAARTVAPLHPLRLHAAGGFSVDSSIAPYGELR